VSSRREPAIELSTKEEFKKIAAEIIASAVIIDEPATDKIDASQQTTPTRPHFRHATTAHDRDSKENRKRLRSPSNEFVRSASECSSLSRFPLDIPGQRYAVVSEERKSETTAENTRV
jgi:hypothetical protein